MIVSLIFSVISIIVLLAGGTRRPGPAWLPPDSPQRESNSNFLWQVRPGRLCRDLLFLHLIYINTTTLSQHGPATIVQQNYRGKFYIKSKEEVAFIVR